MIRARFHANIEDPRPVKMNIHLQADLRNRYG